MHIDIKDKAHFEQIIKENNVVIADFWAPWCGPCKIQGPIFEEAAGKINNAALVKINVDELSDLAGSFNIMSIPTLIVFKSGTEFKREVGVHPLEKLVELANS